MGFFIAIFVGIGLVSKEVEKRSIYSLVSKPVRRSEVVVGKYLGLVLTVVINIAVMTAVWYTVLGYMAWKRDGEAFRQGWEAPATDPRMLAAVYLIVLPVDAGDLPSPSSSRRFSSPMLSAVFTFGLYIAGHFGADLKNFDVAVGDSPVRLLTSGLYYLLPNMAAFDVKNAVVHCPARGRGATCSRRRSTTRCYIVALVAASVWVFSRRDFK